MPAKVSLAIKNLTDRPVQGGLALSLEERLDARSKIAEQTVSLAPKESRRLEFPFNVGQEEMGRGVVATLKVGEELVARRFAFSVARDVYRVAFHGRGVPMFVPLYWDRDDCINSAQEAAEANVRDYVNCWEDFAWAPSDFDEMTPDEEVWASGQTQYRKTKTCIRAYTETFRKYGIRSISYGKSCGGGYVGIQKALERPDLYHTFGPSGFCHEAFSVDVLDRMRENRYRVFGLDEDFWQVWISVWAFGSNQDAYNLGCDEIIASAKMLGWDGVRYDGHFTYWADDLKTGWVIRYCRDRIRKEVPGFSIGYNTIGSTSRLELRTTEGSRACAEQGGMMMNEAYRNSRGNVRPNIETLQVQGDAVRRDGGYYLCIYDVGGDINGALCLAAGCRPMGGTSRSLREFATRYSYYILDERNRRLEQPQKMLKADPATDFIWDSFVFEKEEGPTQSSLIVHLVNISPKLDFGGAFGPIRNLNPPQKDFKMTLSLPEGCSMDSLFVTGLGDGWQPQPARIDGPTLSIPNIGLWTMAVLGIRKPEGFSLARHCELPFTEDEQNKIREYEEAVRKFNAEFHGPATMAKEIKKGRWREPRKYADRDHLGDRLKASPAGILLRNGRLDILHFKGAFYHLHRLDEALSRFENVSTLESLLENGGTNQGLSDRNGDYLSPAHPPDTFLRQDVVVLDNVPASGMSLQSRINTMRFVEAGGGLLLIGGWYTLDKGEFEGSLLEDVLPCQTLQWHSLVRLDAPSALQLGPDALPEFKALNFGEEPHVAWCNNVLPRPGAQVILKVGDQPAGLAGTFGKGRVIVLPLATSGQFPPGKTPYWEWNDWPVLLEACLNHLAGDYHAVTSEPAAAKIKEEEVEELLMKLDELEGEEAVKALRRLTLHEQPATALEIARYLAEHDLDPAVQEELLEYVLPYAGKGWQAVGETMLKRISEPLLPKAGVAILLKATDKPDLDSMQEVIEKLDVLERAKLYAVARNPKSLAWLKQQLAAVLEKEHFFASKRPAKDAPPHLMREQGLWWVRHPFLAAAAFRCGGGPEFAYEYARGVYYLFFYAWRERWVIEGETSAGFDETEEARHLRMRRAARAPYRLAMFHREAASAFEMLLADFEKLKPEAMRAMKEIDCHKAMPAVYRLSARLKPGDWPLVTPLIDTAYEPVRNVAVQFVLRHGGEDGKKQVSEQLLALAKQPPPANAAYVLKRLNLIADNQRMPLLLDQLGTGEATAFEAALRAALTLPPERKLQAISAAQERQDFFARRIREAYGIGKTE
jgi:hypothetical protein